MSQVVVRSLVADDLPALTRAVDRARPAGDLRAVLVDRGLKDLGGELFR